MYFQHRQTSGLVWCCCWLLLFVIYYLLSIIHCSRPLAPVVKHWWSCFPVMTSVLTSGPLTFECLMTKQEGGDCWCRLYSVEGLVWRGSRLQKRNGGCSKLRRRWREAGVKRDKVWRRPHCAARHGRQKTAALAQDSHRRMNRNCSLSRFSRRPRPDELRGLGRMAPGPRVRWRRGHRVRGRDIPRIRRAILKRITFI